MKDTTHTLVYADDLTTTARDEKSLHETLERINWEEQKRGLQINMEKTEYMLRHRVAKRRNEYK